MVKLLLKIDHNENWREQDWALNSYCCGNNHIITTVDVDKGTTPMSLACPVCNELSYSAGYPIPRPYPSLFPELEYEWFRCHRNKVETLGQDERIHHELGGLFLRKRTKKQPIKNPYALRPNNTKDTNGTRETGE